jgi:hypothetical protein
MFRLKCIIDAKMALCGCLGLGSNGLILSAHGLVVNYDDTDMAHFRASTKITSGNGEFAFFWHDNWCGRAPLSLWVPELFKIASPKNRTVAKEMSDNNWICSVTRISMPT